MTDRYPLNWELNSLYPDPETAEFRSVVDDLKSALIRAAEQSEQLPPLTCRKSRIKHGTAS